MNETERIDYFAGHDGRRLHFRERICQGAQEFVILLHGKGEHSGRYEEMMNFFETAKVSSAAFDFRGHGLSEGDEVYVDHFDDYIQDASAFITFITKRHHWNSKIIVLGHSLGGMVAILWALQNENLLKALLLSSPFVGIRLPQFLVRFNRGVNYFFPKFIYHNPVYPPHLTHDKIEVDKYKKDPLIKKKISARLVCEMLRVSDELKKISEWDLDYPVYILMAGLEKVVDAEATRDFYRKLKCPDKELREFKNFYHEIFHEKERSQVYRILLEYLERIKGDRNSLA